jgi:hypothetical protein
MRSKIKNDCAGEGQQQFTVLDWTKLLSNLRFLKKDSVPCNYDVFKLGNAPYLQKATLRHVKIILFPFLSHASNMIQSIYFARYRPCSWYRFVKWATIVLLRACQEAELCVSMGDRDVRSTDWISSLQNRVRQTHHSMQKIASLELLFTASMLQ